MPWSIIDGQIEIDKETGNPVFIQEGDNKRQIVDYARMSKALAEANRESASRREKLSEMAARYEPLKDVEDVAAYAREREELKSENERLKENTDVNLIETKVQAAKEQMRAAAESDAKKWQAQMALAQQNIEKASAEIAGLKDRISRERIRGMFNDSKYVKEQCAFDPSILFDLFGSKAQVDENGLFKGHDPALPNETLIGADGNPASFDHWIHKVIESHPAGKTMLKGSDISNPGGSPRSGGSRKNPWIQGPDYNVTEQLKIGGEDPELAKRLAKEAGMANIL